MWAGSAARVILTDGVGFPNLTRAVEEPQSWHAQLKHLELSDAFVRSIQMSELGLLPELGP
eukprot:8135502-Pyramimonas_sp.AAC.1